MPAYVLAIGHLGEFALGLDKNRVSGPLFSQGGIINRIDRLHHALRQRHVLKEGLQNLKDILANTLKYALLDSEALDSASFVL